MGSYAGIQRDRWRSLPFHCKHHLKIPLCPGKQETCYRSIPLSFFLSHPFIGITGTHTYIKSIPLKITKPTFNPQRIEVKAVVTISHLQQTCSASAKWLFHCRPGLASLLLLSSLGQLAGCSEQRLWPLELLTGAGVACCSSSRARRGHRLRMLLLHQALARAPALLLREKCCLGARGSSPELGRTRDPWLGRSPPLHLSLGGSSKVPCSLGKAAQWPECSAWGCPASFLESEEQRRKELRDHRGQPLLHAAGPQIQPTSPRVAPAQTPPIADFVKATKMMLLGHKVPSLSLTLLHLKSISFQQKSAPNATTFPTPIGSVEGSVFFLVFLERDLPPTSPSLPQRLSWRASMASELDFLGGQLRSNLRSAMLP